METARNLFKATFNWCDRDQFFPSVASLPSSPAVSVTAAESSQKNDHIEQSQDEGGFDFGCADSDPPNVQPLHSEGDLAQAIQNEEEENASAEFTRFEKAQINWKKGFIPNYQAFIASRAPKRVSRVNN